MIATMLHFLKRQAPRVLLAATFLAAPFHILPAAASAARAVTPPAEQLLVQAPLAFVPNAGQSDPRVLFQASSPAGSLFFTAGQLVIVLPQAKTPGTLPASLAARSADARSQAAPATAPAAPPPPSVVQLSFVGANPAVQLSGDNALPGVVNYILGNDPAKWHTDLPSYAGITYHGLYPGIDLRYTAPQGHGQPGGSLKGTYVVAPGADPTQIRWQYAGADAQVDSAGDLRVTIAATPAISGGPAAAQVASIQMVEKAPVSWQMVAGRQVAVETRYSIGPDGLIRFVLPGGYDASQPLILDPTLVYSTYLGDSGEDNGSAIRVDPSGIYIDGLTVSANFPLAGSSYQSASGGGYDAYVTKFKPDGSALIYSTYLGGSGTDYGLALAVDPNGNTYLAGQTDSTNFPVTTGALDTTCGGSVACTAGVSDGFVTRLNANGSKLVYSTFLGGDGVDIAYGVAVNASGVVYVAGRSDSTNFPVSATAYQAALKGATDGFVTKLDTNATGADALMYSTYIGGDNVDRFGAIAIDADGNAYLTGKTNSANYPLAGKPYQSTPGGGIDAVVSVLNEDGSELVYSSYLGGSGDEAGFIIAIDAHNKVTITGQTSSSDLPTSASAYDRTCGTDGACNGGHTDAFVAKFDPAADSGPASLVYSTYFGGSLDDSAQSVALDSAGTAYLVGYSDSVDLYTNNAFQPACGWGCANQYIDAFVAHFNADASAVTFSTFMGGSSSDYAIAVTLDPSDTVYITGDTYSTDFPLASPYQSSQAGNYDIFVARINPAAGEADLAVSQSSAPNLALRNSTLTLTINISNSGTDAASGVRLVDTLTGSFLNPISATPEQGSCQVPNYNVVSCDLGSLAPGAQVKVSVAVVPMYAGTVGSTLNVSSNVSDPNPGNNAYTANTTVSENVNYLPGIMK